MYNRQHSPLTLRHLSVTVSAAISLAAFLCPQRTVAQATVGNVIAAGDLTQSVPDCDNYNTVLKDTGVSANGRVHPGRCRSTALTPLFDGMQLGSNMRAFLDSPTHPPLFQIRTTREKGQYCATNSKLRVTLSASLQTKSLQWTGAPAVCTAEANRVNAVSTPPSPAISPNLRARISALLHRTANEPMLSPQLSGCGPTPAAATLALDQQIWSLLQRVASYEVRLFEASVAPAIDISNSCAAKCNLCFTGWVGTIQCTADANGTVVVAAGAGTTTYLWHEAQTWDVGGMSASGTGGSMDYPANFTSSGGGSATTTVRGQPPSTQSWTVNATKMETLTDHGVNTSKRFTTANNGVSGGIIWNPTNPPSADPELQVQFNADQVGGTTANSNSPTADPTPTIPTCNPTQKPGGIPCTVACTWDLVKQ